MGTREERFNVLWQRHHHAIAKFVLRRLPEHEDPSDVVSEVFMTAWRRLEELSEGSADSRPWLYAVAHKTIANRVRGSRRRAALETRLCSQRPDSVDDPTAKHTVAPGAEAEILVAAFNRLSIVDREAIALVTWEDLTPTEAARVLGIAPARFRLRLHRARSRLRGHASKHEPHEIPSSDSAFPQASTVKEGP